MRIDRLICCGEGLQWGVMHSMSDKVKSTEIIDYPVKVDIHVRQYSPFKIAATMAVGRDAGYSTELLLSGAGLSAAEVENADTLTSIAQYLTVVRNLVNVYPDDDVSIRMGKRLYLSQYGMYGYAMLSARTFRQACEIAIRYRTLVTPIFTTSFVERNGIASLVFWPMPGATVDVLGEKLYRTLLEKQFALYVFGIQEVMGAKCMPLGVEMSLTEPPYVPVLQDAYGCQTTFNNKINALHLSSDWLDRPPRMSSPMTSTCLCNTLGRQLEEFRRVNGVAHCVHEILTRTPGKFPSMEVVAANLRMTSRHLRRKLETEGTSYKALLDGVRQSMAVDFLSSSKLSTEDIAPILGFGDTASFRNAFKRWTGKTPAQYRRAA